MSTWIFDAPNPVVETLGWTLLHFLWQAMLIAVAFAAVRLLLIRFSANSRYLAGCAAMLLLLAAPIITFITLPKDSARVPVEIPVMIHAATATAETAPPLQVIAALPDPSPALNRTGTKPNAVDSATTSLSSRVAQWLPWFVATWLAGVLILSLRMAIGWTYLQRLKRRKVEPMGPTWQSRLEEMRRRLAISRSVQLLKSSLVEVPSVIGWFRPVILIPAASLTGLTPRQLETILAHELAHIRRHDYLANLVQNVVEILLFYHPAVWWVSRKIREERENCCDDVAVELSHEPIIFAEALARLEELRHMTPPLAIRADGSRLLPRIRRVLGLNEEHRTQPRLFGFVAALVIMALAVAGAQGRSKTEPESIYFGKPVSEWVAALDTEYSRLATEVLESAGVEAAPYLAEVLISENPRFSREARAAAATLLGELGRQAEPFAPALFLALEDEDSRVCSAAVHAVRYLHAAGAPAVPQLIHLLEHDGITPSSVIDTLGWIGRHAGEAVPFIVPFLHSNDLSTQRTAAQSLGLIAGHPELAVPPLIEAAQAEDTSLREAAIQALGSFGPDAAPAVPVLVKAFTDADGPEFRYMILRALAPIDLYPPDFAGTLREISTGKDAMNAALATVLLWKNDPENVELRERLIRYLQWPEDSLVRVVTMISLSHMESPPRDLIPVLTESLEDKNAICRQYAAQILMRINPEMKASLAHHLTPPRGETPAEAIDLGQRLIIETVVENDFDAERVVPALLNLFNEAETARAAAIGVADMGIDQTEHLKPFLSDERAYVQLAALDGFLHAGYLPYEFFSTLTDLTRHSDESVRISALERLQRFARPGASSEVVAPLEAAMKDPSEQVRTIASRALHQIHVTP